MSVAGKNMEAIAKAKKKHDATCESPAHTVLMNPFEIERNGFVDGDEFMGMTITADPELGTGTFRLLCDRNGGADLIAEKTDAVSDKEVLV
jgi:hypothetical protein